VVRDLDMVDATDQHEPMLIQGSNATPAVAAPASSVLSPPYTTYGYGGVSTSSGSVDEHDGDAEVERGTNFSASASSAGSAVGAGAGAGAIASASTNGSIPDSLCCDLCGNKFARKSNLLKHKRSVHATTRKHVCVTCGFAFKRFDHLQKHINSTHLKRRGFACEICPAAFAERFNCSKHQRLMHFETVRPFRCGCGAYFQHRDQMEGCLRCKRYAEAAAAAAMTGLHEGIAP
jgi:Zinc finger, C2H2 type